MLLTIPPADVTEVLLDDGVWRPVANGSLSVETDWEARAGGVVVPHTPECGDQCRAGFAFAGPDGVIIAGPLQRIQDVR